MKIIDKTPLQDEKGEIGLIGRIQGTLKYGFNWFAELEAQKSVIAQLDRVLEKGFVLIRNFTLPDSEIVIPMILVGPGGVTVLYITTVKGFFEAKGDQWNTVVNGVPQPARINLLNRVSRYARAVQIFLERQKVPLAAPVEAVLIAADPGAHIDSLRPTARVVMSDAIKQLGTTLLQARPVWRGDIAYSVADQIIDPRPPQEITPIAAQPLDQLPSAPERAQAIFGASEKVPPFESDDLGFAFEEEPRGMPPATAPGGMPARAGAPPRSRKILGMTTTQLLVLGVLFFCECAIVIGFAAYYLMSR
jgi:hypothetical protein